MVVRKPHCWALALVALALSVDCSEEQPTYPTGGTRTSLEIRIDRSNEFAVDLYHRLSSSETNLILPPHNIATAFGMVYAGAHGVTEREIADVFHFNYPSRGFHSAMRILNRTLGRRGWCGGPGSFYLDLANSMWGRSDAIYLPAYLDTMALNYSLEPRYVDFVNRPDESLDQINQWVSDETQGLVRDLLRPGSIDPATYLILVNAIYFRAAWLHQFDPMYTRNGAFTRLDGSVVGPPVMTGEMAIDYYDGDGFQAVGLPYVGQECTMVLLLPDEGNFESFESSLTAAEIDSIVARFGETGVRVSLPKFGFETKYDLKRTLEEMGMTSSFHGGADFSGMDGSDDGVPWISFVAHKSFITVNEWGTLAPAGTGVGVTPGVLPAFDAVRPFIFAVRDDETGTILFLGRVLDPCEDAGSRWSIDCPPMPCPTVSPANRDVSCHSGSTTFSVSTGSVSAPWSASASCSWLSISPVSETGPSTITVNYDDNLSTSSRACTVTLTASGCPERTFTVTQEGRISCPTVSPTNQDVPCYAGSTTFELSAGCGSPDWSTSASCSWLSISPTSGDAATTLTVDYDENPSMSPRVCTITLSAGDCPEKTFTVTQQEATPCPTISPTTQYVSWQSGTTSFSVLSSSGPARWRTAEACPWLSISPTSGTTPSTIIVNYDERRESSSGRAWTMTLSACGCPDQRFTVDQERFRCLYPSPAKRYVLCQPGSTTFFLSTGLASVSWSASEDCDWLSISPTSGTTPSTVTVTYDGNTERFKRFCHIEFIGNCDTSWGGTVEQAPCFP